MKNTVSVKLLILLSLIARNATAQTPYDRIRPNPPRAEYVGACIPEILLPIEQIAATGEADALDSENEEDHIFADPDAAKYLFGQSAFSLRKGKGYYQNTYLVLNSFEVGLTDNISIGGGLELLTTIAFIGGSQSAPIFFINSKAGFEIADQFHLGACLLVGSVPTKLSWSSAPGNGNLTMAYGMGTYGTPDHNLTAGIGLALMNSKLAEKPLLTISGMTRITNSTIFITENWLVPDRGSYMAVVSYGVRFPAEKLSIDLALINNRDILRTSLIGLPYAGFTLKF